MPVLYSVLVLQKKPQQQNKKARDNLASDITASPVFHGRVETEAAFLSTTTFQLQHTLS